MMAVIIMNNQEKPPMRLLSVQKYYSYLYEEDLEMEVSLYINDSTHPIAFSSSYLAVEFVNQEQTKKLEMPLQSIRFGYEEDYLNETYHEIVLYLKLPELNQDFIIEDLLMNITLVNDDQYTIHLGTFSMMTRVSTTSALDWSSLEGHKNSRSFLSRLETISIEYLHLGLSVTHIFIGTNFEVDFVIENQKILLSIPIENMLLDNVPILIHYSENSIQTISNFRYMIDYQILKESGLLIKTYALN